MGWTSDGERWGRCGGQGAPWGKDVHVRQYNGRYHLVVYANEHQTLKQCGWGRWHLDPPEVADTGALDLQIGRGICKGMEEWGYEDSRVAHEVARRIRYRIPLKWEWWIGGGVLIIEAVRLLIGDRGLLGILGPLG